MTKDAIKQVFKREVQAPWTFPESEACLTAWLDLVDPEVTTKSDAWITRMTVTIASLAMALSNYETLTIDPASFRLATILVASSCHGDGRDPDRGRVCSRVTIPAYGGKGSQPYDGIRKLYNERFKDSGLPPLP